MWWVHPLFNDSTFYIVLANLDKFVTKTLIINTPKHVFPHPSPSIKQWPSRQRCWICFCWQSGWFSESILFSQCTFANWCLSLRCSSLFFPGCLQPTNGSGQFITYYKLIIPDGFLGLRNNKDHNNAGIGHESPVISPDWIRVSGLINCIQVHALFIMLRPISSVDPFYFSVAPRNFW